MRTLSINRIRRYLPPLDIPAFWQPPPTSREIVFLLMGILIGLLPLVSLALRR